MLFRKEISDVKSWQIIYLLLKIRAYLDENDAKSFNTHI